MRCPVCKQRVIDFATWGAGINAFLRCDCPNCGAHLGVSKRTVVISFLILASLIPLVVGAAMGLNRLGLKEGTAGIVFGCLLLPYAIGLAYIVWRTGFYSLRDKNVVELEPASQKGSAGTEWWRIALLAGIGFAIIGLMVALGRRDLLLIFDKQSTRGSIIEVNKSPPGMLRDSDWLVWYEFTDIDGMLHTGEDELPPAHPPPENGRIQVVYSTRDPSISRIASQFSPSPVVGVILGLGCLAWSVRQFARRRR
jgi:hypothetical protein